MRGVAQLQRSAKPPPTLVTDRDECLAEVSVILCPRGLRLEEQTISGAKAGAPKSVTTVALSRGRAMRPPVDKTESPTFSAGP